MTQPSSLNIAQRLRDHATRWRDRPALYWPHAAASEIALGCGAYQSKTFGQLEAESNAHANGLTRLGINKGTKTILMVKPGPELFTILFALFKIGAVPVVVDPGMGVRRMLHCYQAVGADAFIGIPVAHAARVLFRKTFASLRVWVTVGRRLGWSGPTLGELSSAADAEGFSIAATGPDDLLMINFTTGSTGPAKGVEYTHRIGDAMVRGIESQFGYVPNDVSLAPLPLFALFDLLIGSTTILPPSDPNRPALADPVRMLNAIESFQVTTMFASPAFLKRVFGYALAHPGEYGEHSGRLSSLKTVVSGGAPISGRIVDLTRRALAPEARVHATYGATEALPIASIESRELLAETLMATRAGRGTCAGRPIAGLLDARIIRITDEAIARWTSELELPVGEVGEIAIAGEIVSPRYHDAARWNALMKIGDGERTWHRTGDLGARDDQGRIWFCGRKSQRLTCPAGTGYTVQWEEIFNGHPEVARCALVGVGPRGRQEAVMCVELTAPTLPARRQQIESELRALAAASPIVSGVKAFLFHRSFPVDIRHNAKINREQLALWAEAMLREQSRFATVRRRMLYAVPIGGWLFVLLGLFVPFFSTGPMWWIWAVVLFLSAVVHPLQLVISLPIGRRAGYTTTETVFYTILLGGTWWKPLSPRTLFGERRPW